ncbi:MAG: hypothetical protein FWB91_13480 [Defluviitaleaceae bacterium]|nr:hypothetical protein [Defluviitaleaceae bacterium]
MNKIISYSLFVTGLILIGLSGYYISQIIRLNLWDDVILRIISVMAFIGGGVFVGLSRVLKNQEALIRLLQKSKEDENDC